jgi:CheY-like chemotaxis protein
LRKFLELGVKVVTGEKNFNIFQDIDGIEFGQRWQGRLDEVIFATRFLIPIMTPLFFRSDACRGELEKFVQHERELGRDDLILPIYFVTAPVLERQDLLSADPLASELSARQRYDWRSQADLPITDPKIKTSVRDLAEKIASALARTETSSVKYGPESASRKPAASNEFSNEKARDSAFRGASETIQREEPKKQSKGDLRTILWVDDKPDNNVFERRAMEAYNIKFDLATSTGEALAKLKTTKFDAIISDMSRPRDSHAGYTLLEALRGNQDSTPYFIYSGPGASDPRHVKDAERRGAQGSTDAPDKLIADVLGSLG